MLPNRGILGTDFKTGREWPVKGHDPFPSFDDSALGVTTALLYRTITATAARLLLPAAVILLVPNMDNMVLKSQSKLEGHSIDTIKR